LESAYQKCLAYELTQCGLRVATEVAVPISYASLNIDAGYRADMLIEDQVIVENKSVDAILPIHQAQLLTYMKLSSFHLGFLLNWNVQLMKHGIKRMILTSSTRQG